MIFAAIECIRSHKFANHKYYRHKYFNCKFYKFVFFFQSSICFIFFLQYWFDWLQFDKHIRTFSLNGASCFLVSFVNDGILIKIEVNFYTPSQATVQSLPSSLLGFPSYEIIIIDIHTNYIMSFSVTASAMNKMRHVYLNCDQSSVCYRLCMKGQSLMTILMIDL